MKSRFHIVNGNPEAIYSDPQEVLNDQDLTRTEKGAVLENWKAEAAHIQESTAEGFDGGVRSRFDEIVAALNDLRRGS